MKESIARKVYCTYLNVRRDLKYRDTGESTKLILCKKKCSDKKC